MITLITVLLHFIARIRRSRMVIFNNSMQVLQMSRTHRVYNCLWFDCTTEVIKAGVNICNTFWLIQFLVPVYIESSFERLCVCVCVCPTAILDTCSPGPGPGQTFCLCPPYSVVCVCYSVINVPFLLDFFCLRNLANGSIYSIYIMDPKSFPKRQT